MDQITASEQKRYSSLNLIVNLILSTSVLYIIIYYVLEKNLLLPLQFDPKTYIMCLIITMVIVSIPSLIIHKIKLN